jgi:hypothetical protein
LKGQIRPLKCARTLSLRLHKKAGNHEEFQLKVDYLGFFRKARIFLLSSSRLINFLALWENFPGAEDVFDRFFWNALIAERKEARIITPCL